MTNLVCLLEERSARAMLEIVLPRLPLPKDVYPQYIVFEGKEDLKNNIEGKLKGYLRPDSVFLIMCDKDAEECYQLKRKLKEKIPSGRKAKVIIACHELESFYLGDLQAVERGMNIPGIAKRQNKAKFRRPDESISDPSKQLSEISNGKYQKIGGSRAISSHLKLDGSNLSNSFRILLHGIRNLAANG